MSYRKLQAIHKHGKTGVLYPYKKMLNLIHNEINASSHSIFQLLSCQKSKTLTTHSIGETVRK